MYVIGTDDWYFIHVQYKSFYSTGKGIYHVIEKIIYNISREEYCKRKNALSEINSNFDIIGSLEKAKEILTEIKNNQDEIIFQNHWMIQSIIDKENNKKFQVDTLKIYELIPTEIKEVK